MQDTDYLKLLLEIRDFCHRHSEPRGLARDDYEGGVQDGIAETAEKIRHMIDRELGNFTHADLDPLLNYVPWNEHV